MAESADNTDNTADTEGPGQDSPPAPDKAEAPPWGSDDEFDPRKAWNLIQNLRKEKAEAAELKRKVAEYESANLTERERLEKERESAISERDATVTELAQLRAAVKYGLEPDDLELLGSGTPEQIDTRAKRLAERLGTATKPPPGKPQMRLRGGGDPTAEPPETDLGKLAERMFRR
jgi:hypothetical protein